MSYVLPEVKDERNRQKAIWTEAQDDLRKPEDWQALINDYNAMAQRRLQQGKTQEARRKLMQVAAIAIAEIEMLDRNL